MICPKCGAENPDDSLFCNKCGSKVKVDSISNKRFDTNIFKTFKDKFKTLSSKQKKIIMPISLIILVLCISGFIIYRNTPKQKAIRVSNTVINSLKTHDGKDIFLTDINFKNETGVGSVFTGLSIFNYKLKSISECKTNETYTIYKINESDSDFDKDVKRYENMYLSNDPDGKWSKDKNDYDDLIEGSANNSVTFTSAKYKVKKYYITYDMNYSEIDGDKKEKDVTVTVQEQTHDKNDFKVIDIIGID